MKRYVLGTLVFLLPVVVGFTASMLLLQEILPDQEFVGTYRISISGLVSRLGIFIGFLAAMMVVLLWWAMHQVDRTRSDERRTQLLSRKRFLRRLDHELKNPLTIIGLGIVNLQQNAGLSGEHAGSLERIRVQAERLQRLVVDLRWLAGIEEHTLERTVVDLKAVLEEVVEMMGGLPEYSGRTVDLSVQQAPWPLSPVWGDRDLLVVVVRNLVDNALKYSTDGDQVQVRATDDGQWAVVEVADSGYGISEDDIGLIFEELYRGANARGVPGSGLGLALVRRIISLHGGTITVRSRAGQGTVMLIRLPTAREK